MTATGIAIATPTNRLLERLASLKAAGPLVLSCYIRLGPQERARSQYQIEVRSAIRSLSQAIERVEVSHEHREMLRRDFDRIKEYLAHTGDLPHTAGLALFASEALGLFEVIPLPQVLRTRVVLDERPRVAEWLAASQRVGTVVAAVVDRTQARFFRVDGFEVEELPGLTDTASRGGKYHSDREDAPGWGEAHFHGRRLEERRRLATHVAQELALLLTRTGAKSIVLGGAQRMADDVLDALPAPLRALVIGMPRLNPTAVTPAEVHQAVNQLRAAAASEQERHLLAAVEQSLESGWSVAGARPTLRALALGQVQTLLMAEGYAAAGFRCPGSGRLVVSPEDCTEEGAPVPVADLTNEAIEEALQQGVRIVVVARADLGLMLDGLAAQLRYQ
jgi:peptide subunit release factor 1 (eRF1)